jgi:hypothetical protein
MRDLRWPATKEPGQEGRVSAEARGRRGRLRRARLQAGPRECGGTRPERQAAQGAAAALAFAPGQAGPHECGAAWRRQEIEFSKKGTVLLNVIE